MGLRQWAKFEFGSIKLKKLYLFHQIEELNLTKEDRCLSLVEKQKELALIKRLGDIRKQEEIY